MTATRTPARASSANSPRASSAATTANATVATPALARRAAGRQRHAWRSRSSATWSVTSCTTGAGGAEWARTSRRTAPSAMPADASVLSCGSAEPSDVINCRVIGRDAARSSSNWSMSGSSCPMGVSEGRTMSARRRSPTRVTRLSCAREVAAVVTTCRNLSSGCRALSGYQAREKPPRREQLTERFTPFRAPHSAYTPRPPLLRHLYGVAGSAAGRSYRCS